jgi:Clp amino terminal domain, pathogenicity island component
VRAIRPVGSFRASGGGSLAWSVIAPASQAGGRIGLANAGGGARTSRRGVHPTPNCARIRLGKRAYAARRVGEDVLVSLFGDKAPQLILLAEDEARMLGRSRVEPVHLLLAFARHGSVADVLGEWGVSARALHATVVAGDGMGDELVLGRLPRSPASDAVLQRAVEAAAERGQWRPGSLQVLLALSSDDSVKAILCDLACDLDLADLVRLVDEREPPRAPRSNEQLRADLVRETLAEQHRTARPPIPAFERFTPDARRAIRAAAESAAVLEHREVEPFHLLIGCLQVPDSFAARVLAPLWEDGELGAIGEAIDLALRYGPPPCHQATGIFSPTARQVISERALSVAYRLGHAQISTGHLLLAVLDRQDHTTAVMTHPHAQRLARTLSRGLPGAEHGPDEGAITWIQFDSLVRTLTLGFRRILPAGWTIFGTARSDIHLRVPDSRSESDFQIRPGWIIAEPGLAPDRLQRVTDWMLERLQAAVIDATGQRWPQAGQDRVTPYAVLIEDRYNPTLCLGYGDPQSPVTTRLEHDLPLNMMISTS